MNEIQKISSSNSRKILLIGGISSLLAGILFRKNLSAEFTLMEGLNILDPELFLIPGNALEWFNLLNSHLFIGMIFLDFFDIIHYILVGLLLIALYDKFQITNKIGSFVAFQLSAFGIIINLLLNPTLTMINLSKTYHSSISVTEQEYLLHTAETVLFVYDKSTMFYLGYLFFTLGCLIFAILMLKTDHFKKWVAVTGIMGYSILLCFFITIFALPDIYYLPIVIAAPFIMIWHIATGIYLLKMGKLKENVI